MTYNKNVTLMCDGNEFEDGASEDCEYLYGTEAVFTTATETREHARKEGWITRGSKDYCPQCK
jgi:hypothetical protein